MKVDPVALMTRYHAALHDFDAKIVTPMFSPEAVYDSPGVNGRIAGRDAIIAAFIAYFAEHPDQRSVDDAVEQTGALQARARWRLVATAASTGQRIVRQGVETATCDAQGRILRVEVRDQ